MTDSPKAQPKLIPGLDIRHSVIDKTYYVSFDLSQFSYLSDDTSLFLVWLYGRWKDETIVFSVNQSERSHTPEAYLPLVNAIHMCSAKTIAKIDHIQDLSTPWAILACDEIDPSPFGLMEISPLVDFDGSPELRRQDAVAAEVIYTLIEKAVAKGWILQEELDTYRTGETLWLTPETLRSRLTT